MKTKFSIKESGFSALRIFIDWFVSLHLETHFLYFVFALIKEQALSAFFKDESGISPSGDHKTSKLLSYLMKGQVKAAVA